MLFVLTQREFSLTTYPIDSASPVFSIICSQDFKEDVGVGAIVSELQEAGETAHTELQVKGRMFIFYSSEPFALFSHIKTNLCIKAHQPCNHLCVLTSFVLA